MSVTKKKKKDMHNNKRILKLSWGIEVPIPQVMLPGAMRRLALKRRSKDVQTIIYIVLTSNPKP